MSQQVDEIHTHSWETDDGWIQVENRLDFPAEFTAVKKRRYLLKKKQKYYKKHINPEYTPGDTVERPIPQEEVKEEPEPEPQPTPEQPEPQAQYQPPPQAQSQPKAKKPTSAVMKYLVYSYVFLHIFVIVSTILVFLGGFAYYYYAIYVTIFVHGSWLFFKEGRPQFNQWYAQRVLQNGESTNLMAALALLACRPSPFGMLPLLCRSTIGGVGQLGKLIRKKMPSLFEKVAWVFQPVWDRQGLILDFAPVLEVYYAIYLVVVWPFGRSSFLSVFLFWNFLRMKYIFSNKCKVAFSKVRQSLQGYISRVPMIQPYFDKLCNYAYSYVDVAQMQQQYQQQQAGGGSSGGMMSSLREKCTIM